MGKLRDQMLVNMKLRNFSPKTIKAYLWHMTEFTRRFRKSPDLLGEEEVRQYLYYLREERKVSWSNVNIAYCALKFFYVDTVYRDWQVKKIPRPKGEFRLPIDLSRAEVRKLLAAVSNQKHRVILMTIYSSGLRVSEAAHLKIRDIESARMQIRVDQGKGKKDRYTLLSQKVLGELRDYWRAYRPKFWLFPGQDQDKPICVTTIQRVFQRAKKKPALISLRPFTAFAIASQPIFSNKALTSSP